MSPKLSHLKIGQAKHELKWSMSWKPIPQTLQKRSWHQVFGGANQFNLGDEGFSKDIATKLHLLGWNTIGDSQIIVVGRFATKDDICKKFIMFSEEQSRYGRIVTKLEEKWGKLLNLMMGGCSIGKWIGLYEGITFLLSLVCQAPFFGVSNYS